MPGRMNRAVVRLAGLACDLFYRRFRLGGEVPADGPLVLVGNHPNGLVDPVLLARAAEREVRFLGKAPLFDLPVLGPVLRGMRALPVYRAMDGADTAQNRDTFAAVYDALERGDAVCLFPEGTTHSRPQLERLRTGAARMALGAEARRGFELGVRLVPVGLLYRDKARFRSKVAVWVGEPLEARELAETYARDEREAVRELTERVADGLRRVTLELDRWEDLPLLELADDVWRAGGGRRVERLRRLAQGARALRARDPARLRALAGRAEDLRHRLDAVGLEPAHLDRRTTARGVARFAARNLLALAAAPLALAGAALWWPPYRLAGPLASLARPDAEVRATAVLLASFVLFPLWWLALVALAGALGGWPWALSALAAAPILGALALPWLEGRARAWKDARVLLRLGRARATRDELRRQRDRLADDLEAVARDLGAEGAGGGGAGGAGGGEGERAG